MIEKKMKIMRKRDEKMVKKDAIKNETKKKNDRKK